VTVDVVAGILIEEMGVLLGQRTREQSFPLQWEFPGGKREPGESDADALVREFREEIGIGVRVKALYDTVEYDRDAETRIAVRFYLVERVSGDPEALQVEAVAWVRRESLGAIDFIPFNRGVVARLVAGS
jgi:8-oxo-dGTP diphosphatase